MRILIISDSHRNGFIVDRIIRNHPDIKEVFFLGDVVEDIEDLKYEYTDKNFHIVSGNCDLFSLYPNYDIIKLEGKNILFTHGNSFDVKNGINRLLEFALNTGCELVLYGHTHQSKIDYEKGVFLVNPGSPSKSRNTKNSYAVVDINEKGIIPSIIEV